MHFLVVPRRHIRDALALTEEDAPLIARMVTTATALARKMGVAESGFRLLSNTGPDGTQTVFHLHLHCIGGRPLGPEAVWDRGASPPWPDTKNAAGRKSPGGAREEPAYWTIT